MLLSHIALVKASLHGKVKLLNEVKPVHLQDHFSVHSVFKSVPLQEKITPKSLYKICYILGTITTDCWTSCAVDSYLSITTHFIADKFK